MGRLLHTANPCRSGLRDDWQLLHVDEITVVLVHSPATGTKGKLIRKVLVGTRRLYEQSSLPMLRSGNPCGFVLTGGQVSAYKVADALMALPVPKPKTMLAD